MGEEKKEEQEITPDIYLLKGMFPDIKKMDKKRLLQEVEMWRNMWQWVPSEVKYYVARTGQLVAITMRNYKRYMGQLLSTKWDIKEIELGVQDMVYDVATGTKYYERKVIRTSMGGIIDFQIIYDRVSEDEMADRAEEIQEQRINDATDDDQQAE